MHLLPLEYSLQLPITLHAHPTPTSLTGSHLFSSHVSLASLGSDFDRAGRPNKGNSRILYLQTFWEHRLFQKAKILLSECLPLNLISSYQNLEWGQCVAKYGLAACFQEIEERAAQQLVQISMRHGQSFLNACKSSSLTPEKAAMLTAPNSMEMPPMNYIGVDPPAGSHKNNNRHLSSWIQNIWQEEIASLKKRKYLSELLISHRKGTRWAVQAAHRLFPGQAWWCPLLLGGTRAASLSRQKAGRASHDLHSALWSFSIETFSQVLSWGGGGARTTSRDRHSGNACIHRFHLKGKEKGRAGRHKRHKKNIIALKSSLVSQSEHWGSISHPF